MGDWPPAWGEPPGSARIRVEPEDFLVSEELGFEPGGSGEHVFLHLEKRLHNTADLLRRVSTVSAVPERDIGYSGLKDRNAVTRQWLSVRLAGRPEPDWQALEDEGVKVLAVARHSRKLRRGVHRRNRFAIRLRQLAGDCKQIEARLGEVARGGVPNYFGPQRFGRGGSTLEQARRWMQSGGRRVSRNRRGLYLSALRSLLFNRLLAERVEAGDWNRVLDGDLCTLQGTRSQFTCETADAELAGRSERGDIHPALPLWGRGQARTGEQQAARSQQVLAGAPECGFLEEAGLELDYRPARVLPDDFCWEFCDDGDLLLRFALPAGSYATAVLAEVAQCDEGDMG